MAVDHGPLIGGELSSPEDFFVMTMHLHGSIFDCKGETVLYFGRLFPAVLTLGVNFVFVSFEGSQC